MTSVAKLPVVEGPTFYDYVAHELANLLPMIDQSNYENLKADIAKQGILEPIVLFEGKILDGRNRYKAAKELSFKFTGANFKTFEGTQIEAEAFVFATNFLRRQMTNAQKQSVIRTMIERYPDESNRQIARRCGISSHSVVASVREKMNAPTPEQNRVLQDLGCAAGTSQSGVCKIIRP
jgi:hypothetical protein